MSLEAIDKIKAAKQNISIETRTKMREKKLGKPSWNKGLTKDDPRVANNSRGGWKHSEATKKIMRDKKLGHPSWNKGLSKATDDRVREYSSKLQGIPKTEDIKRLISESKKGQTPFNKGLTKETSDIVRQYSEKGSETIKKQFEDGRTVWNKDKTQEEDARIISGRKGLTRDISENVNSGAIEQSKKMLQKYVDGAVVWNKGLTKETHRSIKLMSEKRIQYMIENKDSQSNYISAREILFKEWLIELGLIEGEDFIHQYHVRDIVDKYAADFFFPEILLIVEFDGYYWHIQRERTMQDSDRTEQLHDKGYLVLRFLEKERKDADEEITYAKEQLMKVIKYLLEDKNGAT